MFLVRVRSTCFWVRDVSHTVNPWYGFQIAHPAGFCVKILLRFPLCPQRISILLVREVDNAGLYDKKFQTSQKPTPSGQETESRNE